MAALRSDTWMPLYVTDYLGDTMHLTTEQHGAYMLLIMACWKRGGTLPNDEAQLAATARLPVLRWRAIRAVIIGFFLIADHSISHKRVTIELEKAARLSAKRSEIGKRGGRPTKEKQTETNSFPVASKNAGFEKANGKQTETPSPSHPLPDGKGYSDASASAAAPLDLKRELWRVGKAFLEKHGYSEKQAGALLGKWRSEFGDGTVLDFLATAEAREPSGDIAEYIFGCLKRRKSANERTNGTAKRGPATGYFEGAAMLIAEREAARAQRAFDPRADLDPAEPLLDG